MTITSVKSVIAAPERIPGSYEEYCRQTNETRISEWVDGEMITYMLPLLRYQELSGFLFNLLSTFITALKLGKVVPAPFEVKL